MTSIPCRPFGNTGEKVPVLSMGCGFPIGYVDFETSVATIRRAFDLGLRYFDTSPLYRAGESQAILGEALADEEREHFVATKIGHFKDAQSFRSIPVMEAQFRENLRLLRRDSVDLLQIHEADWDAWWHDLPTLGFRELFSLDAPIRFADAPVIQFLRDAKRRGLCRHIGITRNNARHLGRLIRELDGIDSVLVAYNYMPLNASARDHILPASGKKEMATIVAGIFTFISRIPDGWRSEGTYFGKHADEQLVQFQQLHKESGLPAAELVLRWVAGDTRITSLLLGACRPEEVEGNVKAFQKGPLPPDLHAAIDAIAARL